jgi:hypothetical protein
VLANATRAALAHTFAEHLERLVRDR